MDEIHKMAAELAFFILTGFGTGALRLDEEGLEKECEILQTMAQAKATVILLKLEVANIMEEASSNGEELYISHTPEVIEA